MEQLQRLNLISMLICQLEDIDKTDHKRYYEKRCELFDQIAVLKQLLKDGNM